VTCSASPGLNRSFPRPIAGLMSNVAALGSNVRVSNKQPCPAQLRRMIALVGNLLTLREVARVRVPLTDQLAEIRAGFGSASWYRPHGGFACMTRPGRHVATNLANRVTGSWAVIVYPPGGTLVQTTPPSFEEAV
jgi:hypothetical protein